MPYTELNATTLQEIYPRVVNDNFFLAAPFLAYLRDHCMVPFTGGAFMQSIFRYAPMIGGFYAPGAGFNITKRTTIAKIPYLTDGGTFVHKGSEYILRHQARLHPGAYTREKENGEIESHSNILRGGPGHRYSIDPAKGIFYVDVRQSHIPLLPLLHELGADDKEIQKAWGPEIYAANVAKADASALPKLQARFSGLKKLPLREAFDKMELDPEVTERTLGKPYAKMDAQTIMAITKKLLAVSRKEAETDDRDHLAYQQVMGPEDLIAERIAKDRAGVRRHLLYRMSGHGHLQHMPASALQLVPAAPHAFEVPQSATLQWWAASQ